MNIEKECSKCHELLPADLQNFHSDARMKDHFRSICKACYSELPCMRRRTANVKREYKRRDRSGERPEPRT